MTTVRRRRDTADEPESSDEFVVGDAALEAQRQLEKQRIPMPHRPRQRRPGLPDDPTELTDSELMRSMALLTRWAEFEATQLAMAEVDERYAESAMEKERALSSLRGKIVADGEEPKPAKSVTEQKARAYESPEFLEAQQKYQHAHAYRKLASVLYENTDRSAALLSRELTRRVGRDPRERRVERWQA